MSNAEYYRQWYHKHPERNRASKRLYYAKNRELINAGHRKRYHENRNHRRKLAAVTYQRNKYTVRDYQRRRMSSGVSFRIRARLSQRICKAVKGDYRKSKTTLALLGCSIPSFRIYIESKFETGMTWSNYGRGKDKWHLDHIVPCQIFDLSKPEHQKLCFHFSNYQPMWETQNLSKGKRSNGQLMLI